MKLVRLLSTLLLLMFLPFSIMAQSSSGSAPDKTQQLSDSPAEIQIGQPKFWRYDRMFPVLDGMLRDVEGVSMNSLTGLDPSEANSRMIDLLQQVLGVSVTADQAAGISNGFAVDTFNATRNSQLSQLQNQGVIAQSLLDQKATIVKLLSAAIDEQTKRLSVLPTGTSCADDTQCAQAKQHVTDLTAQLGTVQAAITAAGVSSPSSTGPTGLSSVAGQAIGPSTSGIDPKDFVKTAMALDPKTVGSLPARERLDNFITLLNDRLTKQLALSLDERGLSDSYIPMLMEFDVAVQPNLRRKNQIAISSFALSSVGSDCGVPITYSIFPSMAAFNVANVSGESNGFYANGGFKGLFLGSNISFQRQRDHVSESLRQSVYISGFRNGESRFGWYYGPPAYTSTVRPGVYSTFAIVLVPKGKGSEVCKIAVNSQAFWQDKHGKNRPANEQQTALSANDFPIDPDIKPPLAKQVQYSPHYGSKTSLQNDVNVIAVEFEQPTNPNLLITASGKLLKRVRDWRGRATNPTSADVIDLKDSSGASRQVSRARGLFEADIDEADTWIAVSQTKILIKLSYATAGAYDFPNIRFLVPGAQDWDLREIADYRTYDATIKIGEKEFFACHPKLSAFDEKRKNSGCMRQPYSLWLPLFGLIPETNHQLNVIQTYAAGNDAPDNSGIDGQRYIFLTVDDGSFKLSASAQVTLSAPAHSRYANPIALECAPMLSGLMCHLHPSSVVLSAPGPGSCLLVTGRQASIVDPKGNVLCDWRKYRLQVKVMQAPFEDRPSILVTANLPSSDAKFPVIGRAISAERLEPAQAKRPPTWRFEFSVQYPGNLPRGTSLCLSDAAGEQVGIGMVSDSRNDDSGRSASLAAQIFGDKLQKLLDSRIQLRGTKCTDDITSVLTGFRELVIPKNVELVRSGANKTFYELKGENLGNVRNLVVGSDSSHQITVARIENGVIADLSGTKVPIGESLVFYDIDGLRVPISACWDQPKAPDAAKETKSDTQKTEQATKDTKANSTTPNNPVQVVTVVANGTTPGSSNAADANKDKNASTTPTQTEHVCGELVLSKAASKPPPNSKQPAPGQPPTLSQGNKKPVKPATEKGVYQNAE